MAPDNNSKQTIPNKLPELLINELSRSPSNGRHAVDSSVFCVQFTPAQSQWLISGRGWTDRGAPAGGICIWIAELRALGWWDLAPRAPSSPLEDCAATATFFVKLRSVHPRLTNPPVIAHGAWREQRTNNDRELIRTTRELVRTTIYERELTRELRCS